MGPNYRGPGSLEEAKGLVVQPAASCCVTRAAWAAWAATAARELVPRDKMACKDLSRSHALDKTAAHLPSSCCECKIIRS